MPLQRARLRISDYKAGRTNRQKEYERRVREVSLSLTSMVDMFAVLVVYLIINSSNLKDWVAMAAGIELPQAKAEWGQPEMGATIQVKEDMVIGGRDLELVAVKTVTRGQFVVPQIRDYLKKQENKNGYVNVVADYRVPFGAMRRIIASCQNAGFTKVNLAIQPTKAN